MRRSIFQIITLPHYYVHPQDLKKAVRGKVFVVEDEGTL